MLIAADDEERGKHSVKNFMKFLIFFWLLDAVVRDKIKQNMRNVKKFFALCVGSHLKWQMKEEKNHELRTVAHVSGATQLPMYSLNCF